MTVPLNDAVRKLLDDPNPAVLATVTADVGRELAVRLEEQYGGAGAGDEYLRLPPEAREPRQQRFDPECRPGRQL